MLWAVYSVAAVLMLSRRVVGANVSSVATWKRYRFAPSAASHEKVGGPENTESLSGPSSVGGSACFSKSA